MEHNLIKLIPPLFTVDLQFLSLLALTAAAGLRSGYASKLTLSQLHNGF